MATGIPAYRLPRDILKADIDRIVKTGVRIELLSPVEDLGRLFTDGYEAVFVATGAMKGQTVALGETLPRGVVTGVEFLKGIHVDGASEVGDEVVVIGGGNSAIDSARAALRLGAKRVTIAYRRAKADMPASPEEIAEAIEEGVEILDMTSPVGVVGGERVEGLRCASMAAGPFDASGRRRPVPSDRPEIVLPASMVIVAAGQEATGELLRGAGIEVAKGGLVAVDPVTMGTSRPGIFAGGDATSGPATVVEAIGAGRRAAIAIDRFLGGPGAFEPEERVEVATDYDEDAYTQEQARAVPPMGEVRTRIRSFAEVRGRFAKEQAIEEARRCLHCDRKQTEDGACCESSASLAAGAKTR
jgi:NADH-quinone oxidoreductase subunit F